MNTVEIYLVVWYNGAHNILYLEVEMENKYKHLEMIQSIVARMAANSFQLKGLCVTIAVAISALAVVRSNAIIYLLMLIPIIAFWVMDAYYLRQEKLFRALYDDVSVLENDKVDFSMDTSRFKETVPCLFKCIVFNGTTTGFYVPFAIIFVIMFYLAAQSADCAGCAICGICGG